MISLRRGLCSTPLACMVLLTGFVILISGRNIEKLGDHMQVALPVAGLACAAMDGRALQYFGRYLLVETLVKGSKYSLGDAPINQRPNGGSLGFPSGHTAAASFGATALVTTCLKNSHAAQMVAIVAAGFVGTSRVDAGKHTPWQVLAGAIVGWALQVFALTAFDRAFGRAMRWVWKQLRTGVRLPRKAFRLAQSRFGKTSQ